ncbi:MAG: hypothetical protein SXG53_10400 [Pseudomonadota bacterium]|nr:hypothetical protein [Pseudomonadota bacterium]
MKRSHRSILSRLDDALRWTGIPARVAADLSDEPPVDRNHRPLRWFPLFYLVVSCVLIALPLIWLLKLDHVSPRAVVGSMTAIVVSVMTGGLLIHVGGPLGKPSREDDEREAALRKESFLFCLALLAGLNCLGQPILMVVSHWQNWPATHSAVVALCTLILNATLLGTLPTLYASWHFRQLPRE